MSPSHRITLERHIISEQSRFPEASGEFSQLMRDLTLAARMISREVRRAGLGDIFGTTTEENVHGQTIKRLDLIAHQTICACVEGGGHVAVMVSEEAPDPIYAPDYKGKYVLLFDPLDGSSNIEVNATIGTIFSIYRRLSYDGSHVPNVADVLQAGVSQLAAGYICYGSSTQLVYTSGSGTNIFTFEPSLGEFFLTHLHVKIPRQGKYYFINEGNHHKWSDAVRACVSRIKAPNPGRSLRYSGSLVGDVNVILEYGGIFMYPAQSGATHGKLRLLYELNPIALIIEQAGGKASTGTDRILEVCPQDIHQCAPIYAGSATDVDMAIESLATHR